ncbi:MAG TPA: gliding motility-associated C-terminal domain-containing protein [Bacteroidales bacterium]|nr:gliding motility-associated C-terminal domain-containing protein [Bacteroidales bacterium]
MNYTRYLLIWFLLQAGFCVQAQLVPNKPSLYLVTVDIETGNDMIYWTASPTPPNFSWYVIAVAERLNENEPPSYRTLTTVAATETQFENTNPLSSLGPVGYTVFAWNNVGSGYASLFDAPDSTIFLTLEFDSCEATISLAWNDYNNWRGSIAAYNIYRRMGPGIYQLLATVAEGTNTYVLGNVGVNANYDLFVEAVHQDNVRRSNSNRASTFTLMSQQPDFINADYATIGAGNSIDMSFTVGGSTGLTRFNILRSSSPTGPFNTIATTNTSDSPITFTDDLNFQSGIYYYRLELINNCGTASAQSNLANNIILNGTFDNQNATLSWNGYLDWLGGVAGYSLIRTNGIQNPQTDILDAGVQTNYTDDISGLIDQSDPSSSMICYHVEATENTNIHGIQGRSVSNRVCFSLTPDVRIPNAFIPNDTDPVNQVFEPVFSFMPEHYDLIIYNRLGVRIWQGSGPWDGRVNGNYVPEGVYLYYLRIYNYSTDKIEQSGSVTVVYR